MTVRTLLVGSLLTALSAWFILTLIIMYLDPRKAGVTGLFLFFLTLFLAVASTSGLIEYIIRRIIAPRALSARAVRPALRQGILLGLFLNILLVLQLLRLYHWWLAIIITAIFLSIELTFISHDKTYARKHRPAEK